MNLTFRQLRVFTEVARHGSMARAAEVLHLTPLAVSMLGRLFQRTPLHAEQHDGHVVHVGAKVLSPAAEAFRHFFIEEGAVFLRAHDAPLLATGAAAAER